MFPPEFLSSATAHRPHDLDSISVFQKVLAVIGAADHLAVHCNRSILGIDFEPTEQVFNAFDIGKLVILAVHDEAHYGAL